jgi:hypothetical protein
MLWIYVGYILLQCAIEQVGVIMETITTAFQQFSLSLQRRKCMVHIPAFAATPWDDWPQHAQEINSVLLIAVEGLTLLGTEAAREHALPLGPRASAT